MSARVAVIGIGNEWCRDDGAGLEVVRRAALRLGPEVEVHELDGEPARVVDAWDGAALAVLVDAVRTGAAPGTLHHVELTGDAPGWATGTSARAGGSHALGPADAYRLGATLDRVPSRLVLLGIEIGDVTPGTGLSPAVDASVPAAVDALVTMVRDTQDDRSP